MDATSPRWQAITDSEFPWEQNALTFVRDRLHDHDPYRAWANFEFIADDGSINEVDLLVLTPKGFYLVEIKSRPGIVEGDQGTWTWRAGGRVQTVDNPLLLANRKAKKLISLLRRQPALQRTTSSPFLEAHVFLSHEDVDCRVAEDLRDWVHLRDTGAGRDERPGIVAALTRHSIGTPVRTQPDRPTARRSAAPCRKPAFARRSAPGAWATTGSTSCCSKAPTTRTGRRATRRSTANGHGSGSTPAPSRPRTTSGRRFDRPLAEQAEPPLHLVQPGRRGGREVQMEARSRRQPPLDLGVLVRRVVVQYQVDVQLRRHLPVDQAQERQELFVAVPLPALPEAHDNQPRVRQRPRRRPLPVVRATGGSQRDDRPQFERIDDGGQRDVEHRSGRIRRRCASMPFECGPAAGSQRGEPQPHPPSMSTGSGTAFRTKSPPRCALLGHDQLACPRHGLNLTSPSRTDSVEIVSLVIQ